MIFLWLFLAFINLFGCVTWIDLARDARTGLGFVGSSLAALVCFIGLASSIATVLIHA